MNLKDVFRKIILLLRISLVFLGQISKAQASKKHPTGYEYYWIEPAVFEISKVQCIYLHVAQVNNDFWLYIFLDPATPAYLSSVLQAHLDRSFIKIGEGWGVELAQESGILDAMDRLEYLHYLIQQIPVQQATGIAPSTTSITQIALPPSRQIAPKKKNAKPKSSKIISTDEYSDMLKYIQEIITYLEHNNLKPSAKLAKSPKRNGKYLYWEFTLTNLIMGNTLVVIPTITLEDGKIRLEMLLRKQAKIFNDLEFELKKRYEELKDIESYRIYILTIKEPADLGVGLDVIPELATIISNSTLTK